MHLQYLYFLVVVVVDCQADLDVDNVQRRQLVHFYGGIALYIRVIIIILVFLRIHF